MENCKVITWQTPSGEKINVTPKQEKMARKMGKWPRSAKGEEYCTVSHGLHCGMPTYDVCGWKAIISQED